MQALCPDESSAPPVRFKHLHRPAHRQSSLAHAGVDPHDSSCCRTTPAWRACTRAAATSAPSARRRASGASPTSTTAPMCWPSTPPALKHPKAPTPCCSAMATCSHPETCQRGGVPRCRTHDMLGKSLPAHRCQRLSMPWTAFAFCIQSRDALVCAYCICICPDPQDRSR